MTTIVGRTPDKQTPGPRAAPLAQRWLRVGDVARKLGVSANTVRRWTDEGRLLSYRSPGGHRRYLAQEIAGLIVAQPPADSTADGKADIATQLRVFVELGSLLAENEDLGAFMAALASRLREAVGACDVDIWRLQDDRMRCLVSVDESGIDRSVVGGSFATDLFPEHHAAFARGEVFIRTDLADPALPHRERAVYEQYGYRSSLSVPIIAGHAVIGTVDLYDRAPRDWSTHADFVASLTQSIAGSFKNAVLLRSSNAATRRSASCSRSARNWPLRPISSRC
jgi:excisionase family DNA binding protein